MSWFDYDLEDIEEIAKEAFFYGITNYTENYNTSKQQKYEEAFKCFWEDYVMRERERYERMSLA